MIDFVSDDFERYKIITQHHFYGNLFNLRNNRLFEKPSISD